MDYAAILSDAMSKKIGAERPQGCCRVYVSISDDAAAKAIAKVAKQLSLDFQKRSYYGTKNALYIGYDNMDGQVLARGSAVVNALKAAGISCYRDEQGD
jgi:hypothetical protein